VTLPLHVPSVGARARPITVTVIVVVSVFGWLTTEGFWVYLHLTGQIPAIAESMSYWERSYLGLVRGFAAADLIWSNLVLVVSVVGLWRMRAWGWTAAMMANTIWIYTSTFTLVRDMYVGITAGMVFFLAFALFAVWATAVLWRERERFWA
jgi:hypothetical protein